MKPKLLVLTSTFPRWQGDTDPPFVYHLSKRLTKQFDVTIHTPHYPGARSRETIDGMQVHRFRYFFSPFEKLAGSTGILPTLRRSRWYYFIVPFFLMAQFSSLFLLFQKIRPEIIHAHWLFPQGFMAVCLKFFWNIPVVITAHGADVFGLQGKIFNKIKYFTVLRSDKIVVVSRALQKSLRDTLPLLRSSRILTLPMGVCSSTFAPDKKHLSIRKKYGVNGPLLLYVGRLTEKKGVTYLINAMPAVLREHRDTSLLIVGSGELASRLRMEVKSLKLEEKIFFAGSVLNKELPGYYADADIFIGPSIQADGGDTEGFGLTFVEAAMSGCLVIGTDVGGIRDIIQDGETGFIVPQKNPQVLAEKILYALQHKDEMYRITKNARKQCIEKFDWQGISARYSNIISGLLEE